MLLFMFYIQNYQSLSNYCTSKILFLSINHYSHYSELLIVWIVRSVVHPYHFVWLEMIKGQINLACTAQYEKHVAHKTIDE